jgi:glycosyltransferase involved in cell wall biosynthesis
MRAGLPVIASDVGGTRELVATGATGCLVPRGDVEAMRAALARLLTRPQVRAEMGRRGRERYEEQFHFDAMLAKTTAVYRQVLEGQFVRTRRPSHAAATHKSRVVHVVESFGAGTAEVIGRLTRGMPEYEHVVVHGSRREATTVGRDALGPGVSMVEWGNAFREINPAQDLSALVRLMAILRRLGRVDVLHAHGSKGGFHGRLAARLLGRHKSVIYTSHGSPILRRDVGSRVRTLYSALEWLGSRFGGTVVACSGSEQVALRRAGITALVVPNGTDLERRPVRPRLASPAPFRVGTVARVVRQKDPLLFRRIAERFHVQPDTQFLWIGGGELAAELQGRNVAVTGWLDERGVQDHLGRLDVYLSTSLWEGLSLGALHAMAAGKPLVLRRCPGNVDVVRHGENGFLFDDAEEAEAHIRVLTGDPALRYEMGRRSREIVAEAFDARRMVEAYRSLYRSLIGGRHPVIAPDATEALRHDGAIGTGPRSVPAADVVQPGIGIGPQMPRPGERSRRGRFTPQLRQTPATVK